MKAIALWILFAVPVSASQKGLQRLCPSELAVGQRIDQACNVGRCGAPPYEGTASGPFLGALPLSKRCSLEDARQAAFVMNGFVVFQDVESCDALESDYFMTGRALAALEVLSELVMMEWQGQFVLRVTEAYSKQCCNEHGGTSRHYEGRALDLTLMEVGGDPRQPPTAAAIANHGRLAILAHETVHLGSEGFAFTWVFHEGDVPSGSKCKDAADHVHASVPRDPSIKAYCELLYGASCGDEVWDVYFHPLIDFSYCQGGGAPGEELSFQRNMDGTIGWCACPENPKNAQVWIEGAFTAGRVDADITCLGASCQPPMGQFPDCGGAFIPDASFEAAQKHATRYEGSYWGSAGAGTVVVVLGDRVVLKGMVRDQDGIPVAGAAVQTDLDNRATSTLTIADGSFFLITDRLVVLGVTCCIPYAIEVSHPGCQPLRVVAIWGDSPHNLVFSLNCP